MTAVAKRVVLWFAFQRAKNPEHIKEVLEMVYSSNGEEGSGIFRNQLSVMLHAGAPAAKQAHQAGHHM
jgi:hypothetical protein